MPLSDYFDKDFIATIEPLAEAMGEPVEKVIQNLSITRYAQHSASQEIYGTPADGEFEFAWEKDQEGNRNLITGKQLFENKLNFYTGKYADMRERIIRADMEHVGFDGLNESDQEFLRQLSRARAKVGRYDQGEGEGGFSGEDGFDFKAKAAEIRRREQEDESD